jgi:hypothetical protein
VCTGTSLMVIHYYSCMVTDNRLGFTDIRGTLHRTQLEGNRGVQTWKLPEKQPLIARGLLRVLAQRVWCNQVNSPHSNVLFSRTSYRNYNGLERKYYNQYATVQQKVERVFQKLFRKTIRLNCPLCVTPSTSSKHIAATGCADKEKSAHQVYLFKTTTTHGVQIMQARGNAISFIEVMRVRYCE